MHLKSGHKKSKTTFDGVPSFETCYFIAGIFIGNFSFINFFQGSFKKIMRTRNYCSILTCFLLVSKIFAVETNSSEEDKKTLTDANRPHSRQKRLIWVTDDGRLALPPGTSLIIAPTLTMPFVRYPPEGTGVFLLPRFSHMSFYVRRFSQQHIYLNSSHN